MLRLTVKHLWANKLRFALTTFGVTLAVSFVVSAFVLGDGLRATFSGVSEEITAGVDLEVRGVANFGESPPLPIATVSAVADVDGVAAAVPTIESAANAVRPIRPDGEVIPTNGPPQLAFNWIDNPELSAFRLVEGAPPQVGEFTIDRDSATRYGFVVGDTYELIVPGGRVHLTLSGTSSFGADNSTLGAVLMQMNTAQASELFGVDGVSTVAVQVADGAEPATVQAAIAAAVPDAEVVDHAAVLAETTTEFTREIDVVGNILLGFGAIALFVSIFIIYNTFGIVLSQRTRELALLRTIGADPRQVRRSALGEALVMGVLSSAGGIAGGVGVAKGLDALFGLMGIDLSEWPLILAPRTLVAAGVTGIGVTLLAAIGPSRRAAKVPLITALGHGADSAPIRSRRRIVTGASLIGVGVLAGALGGAAVAAGLVAIFVGVTLLSPLAVDRVTRLLGWPMRKTGGVAGRLAQLNAARNPRRTATTAAALMIGLTMVTTALVVAQSIKTSIRSTFERAAVADYYVTDELDEVDFPASLAGDLRQQELVDAAAGFTQFDARIGGDVTGAVGFDFAEIDALIDFDLRAGSFANDVDHPVVVSVDEARATGVDLGDQIPVEVASGARVDATVVGLFDDQSIMSEDYLFDTRVLTDAGVEPSAVWLAVSIADTASPDAVAAFVASVSERYPNAFVETASAFRDRMSATVDTVLTMVNMMVGLAVVIALIGIANTLALSVFERTRELGLLRAVGMTPRQVRRMVRYEAALIATFGAAVGTGLGLVFGFAVISVLPAWLASGFSVPVGQIAIEIVIAATAGSLAAWLPARRVGRLDVLDAIAH